MDSAVDGVFGKTDMGRVDLESLGGSFELAGAAQSDSAGLAVAGVGEVNGDGRSDVSVGALLADPLGRNRAGTAYVVKTDSLGYFFVGVDRVDYIFGSDFD